MVLLEDNPQDADLLLRMLQKAGFDVSCKRTDNEQDFTASLDAPLDLIISDYNLPFFNGVQALQIVRSRGLQVPFILVSGVVGEELAVEAMRQGASDYLMKDRLTRLGEAVRRAIEEARMRKELGRAEVALEGSQDRYAALIESAMDAIVSVDEQQRVILYNSAACELFGHAPEHVLGQPIDKLIPHRFRGAHIGDFAGKDARPSGRVIRNVVGLRADGTEFPAETSISQMTLNDQKIFTVILRDITERQKAIEQIQQTQEFLRQVVETIDEVFWMTDTEKDVMVYISPGYEKIWGRPAANLYTNPQEWLEAIHADDRARVLQALPGQATGTYNIEYRILRPDGQVRWIHDRAFPVEDESGKVYRVTGVAKDITARREDESRLILQSEALEAAASGILITDAKGIIQWANPAFLKMSGYSMTETIGKRTGDLLKSGAHDDSLYTDLWKTILSGRVWAGTIINRRKNGQRYFEEMTITPVKGRDGSITHFVAVKHDVTDRINAEAELKHRQDALEQSQKVANIGSWEADLETGQAVWSKEQFRLLGLEPHYESLTFDSYLALVHPEDRELLRSTSQGAAEKQQSFELVHRIIRRDGEVRWMRSIGQTVTDASGKAVRMRGTNQDITAYKESEKERQRLEDQFLQAQKLEAIGRLSGGVAHDFNNLLTVILGHVAILETCNLDSDAIESAHAIKSAGERAANLTRQLLLFARRQTMQMALIDLNKTVTDTTRMLSRILGEDVLLDFRTAQTPLFVQADPGMLDQVLMNLAVNARDAMPRGGRIVIETSAMEFDEQTAILFPQVKQGWFAVLSVSDSGTGISAEVLPKIFDPFFTTKDVGKGTGLGLATVYSIVQQHGGWISAYSEEGKGASFRIYIPLSSEGAVAMASRARTDVPRGTETILLAEDEPAIRSMVVRYLSQLGYTVLAAGSGPEAVQVFLNRKNEISLLVTDMVMPGGMSGIELSGIVISESPGVGVLYTSGYSELIIAGDLALKEGENFLSKPFDLAALARTVRTILDAAKTQV